jgi:hypothetical protein
MPHDEHDDDLSPTVEQRGDAQMESFPDTVEAFEDLDDDIELDNDDVVNE